MSARSVIGLHVDGDRVVGREGGFLAIRRLNLRNRRDDGSLSEPYLCDFAIRPMGLDAVVVAVWHRAAGGGIQVLVRDGLRPPLTMGRPPERQVVPDRRDYLFFTELVAGIIEEDDRGEAGLRDRATAEVLEEAGYRVDPAAVQLLGAAVFPSPGALAEKFYLAAVEIADPADQVALEGDGSPMEEGATVRWLDLDAAIAACVRGDIEDCKTELGLRRLKDIVSPDTGSTGNRPPAMINGSADCRLPVAGCRLPVARSFGATLTSPTLGAPRRRPWRRISSLREASGQPARGAL